MGTRTTSWSGAGTAGCVVASRLSENPDLQVLLVEAGGSDRAPIAQRVWTGLYDQNRLDGNAVIGNWLGQHDNVYVAAGFSGHGFMHALGVGRGLTEHLLTGDYRTVDLTRLGYARIEAKQPYAELGVR